MLFRKENNNSSILTKIEKKDTKNKEFFENGILKIPAYVPGTKIPVTGIAPNVIDPIDTIYTKFSFDEDLDDEFPNNIIQINIPPSIESIGPFTFKDCKNLMIIKFQKFKETNKTNLKRIESNAFNGCKALKELVIPESVEYIGVDAFRGCESLKKLIIRKSNKRRR